MDKKLTKSEFMKRFKNDYYNKRFKEKEVNTQAFMTSIEGVERTSKKGWKFGQY